MPNANEYDRKITVWVVIMKQEHKEKRRQQIIEDLMKGSNFTRMEAEVAAAIELGEITGDIIDIHPRPEAADIVIQDMVLVDAIRAYTEHFDESPPIFGTDEVEAIARIRQAIDTGRKIEQGAEADIPPDALL